MNIAAIALVGCCLQQLGIAGPIAFELAVVAEARRALEDGPNRSADESVPGVGLDPEHTKMLNKVKILFPNLHHDLVTGDAESGGTMRLYRLKGEGAQIAGAVLVGLVLDSYPYRFGRGNESFNWEWIKMRSLHSISPHVEGGIQAYLANTYLIPEMLRKQDARFGPNPPSAGRKP